MKSIIIDIDEKDLNKLNIEESRLSFDELLRKIKLNEMRQTFNELEQISKNYGWDKLSEEEIFVEVGQIKML